MLVTLRIRQTAIAFFASLVLFGSVQAVAQTVPCPSLETIDKVASDDICQWLSSAAESCFARLNLRFSRLQSRNALKLDWRKLKYAYESGIKTTSTYFPRLSESGGCDNEAAEVAVSVEELQKDLKEINKRLR